jgi:hypothetical protein
LPPSRLSDLIGFSDITAHEDCCPLTRNLGLLQNRSCGVIGRDGEKNNRQDVAADRVTCIGRLDSNPIRIDSETPY